eukprot:TRINITY_DN9408_c0_g1_i1.p1 TRINITY_DN9408_c0_g1~~TRINITY_DN9408_c0_g1_i1.p1  ORF type:complete len:132 (-),score=28.69 TRINITY_DN9408_c0_g1_i1:2-397(-)
MPHDEEVYTVGTVSSQGEEKIHVVEESGKDTKFKLNDKHKDELPPLKNTIEAPDELTRLPFLHEPAVLHNLRARYEKDIIYTYTGPVLVAVNPFKVCPAPPSFVVLSLRIYIPMHWCHLQQPLVLPCSHYM